MMEILPSSASTTGITIRHVQATRELCKQAAEQDIAEKREAADRMAAELMEQEKREEAAAAETK
jgi:hypothetical protein